MKLPSVLRTAGLLILMTGVTWFFAGEIQLHWHELENAHLNIRWPYILIGEMLVFVTYLVATLAWRETILFASTKKLTFAESVGLVNISQLTKYVPGKVWAYAIQMHMLSSHGISKTWVVSVNIIMLLSLVTSATVIGFGYLAFTNTYLPQVIALAILAASLVFYIFLIFGGAWSVNALLRLANALLKLKLVEIKVPLNKMVAVHGLYLVSNLSFGLAGYFIAIGIGLPQDLMLVIPIIATMLLSDTIGFFAFFVPGGIGVREGVMYAMLKSAVDIQTCFILPVAFRLVTAFCDLVMGGFAMVLLNRFAENSKGQLHLKNGVEKNE